MAFHSSLLLYVSLLLSLAALVSAHGNEDHSTMPGKDDGSGETMGMMKMWFHFTRGDTLLFESWTPVSAGSFAAACIVLVVLGIVDRAINAVRAAAEAKWSFQAQPHLNPSSSTYNVSSSSSMPTIPLNNPKNDEALVVSPRMRDLLPGRGPPASWVQPRKLGRDAVRAGLQAIQSGLGLVLMLSVMSFNVWFLLSVVVGLAIGEFFWGS
ncbi:Ctr copper transporter family-domain-containing protein [Mrakia frigida]|uniref:copper transporter family protein n=1 Tax=Mrakia frigida TaxID=29902 RepID=UPI003FCBF4E0